MDELHDPTSDRRGERKAAKARRTVRARNQDLGLRIQHTAKGLVEEGVVAGLGGERAVLSLVVAEAHQNDQVLDGALGRGAEDGTAGLARLVDSFLLKEVIVVVAVQGDGGELAAAEAVCAGVRLADLYMSRMNARRELLVSTEWEMRLALLHRRETRERG